MSGQSGEGSSRHGRDEPHSPSERERVVKQRRDRPSSSRYSESSSTIASRNLEEQSRSRSSSGQPATAPGTSAPGTSAPAASKDLARRPGFGTLGMKCRVRANHFLVNAAGVNKITQYEISFDPEVTSRAICRALMKELIQQYGDSHLGQRIIVYDGRHIFYTAGSLPFVTHDFKILLLEKYRRPKTFKLTIRFARSVDTNALKQFLDRRQKECPYDAITALDIALRETPTNKCVTISRSFFSRDLRVTDIGQGLECWQGYFQSLRPTQMGLSLNTDIATTPFYKSIHLLDFIVEFFNFRSLPNSLSEKERLEIHKALKGVRVETTHLLNVCRQYKIKGITSQPATQLMFTLDEPNGGTEISVAQYFEIYRKHVLKYDSLPCIKAGSDSKPNYLPMEVCKIVAGQRYIKKLNDLQVTRILKATCMRPADREKSIFKLVDNNNYNKDKHVMNFGMKIETHLTTAEARVLRPPKLKYHDRGRETDCEPKHGKWNMFNKKFHRGGTLDTWACISFCRHSIAIIQAFCRELVLTCNNFGMVFNQVPVYFSSRPPSEIDKTLYEFHHQSGDALSRLQLLIVFLPEAKGSYGRIKKICETELGIVTQCCQPKHLQSKPNKQYFENLALKINVKVGGCNVVLEDSIKKQVPVVSAAPTIIFGADVTHPSPGEDSPSIAAVVASMDAYITKYGCLLSAQPRREEIIEDLFKMTDNGPQGMIRELLLEFYRETGYKPEHIIFYRDGVSEGQFKNVLSNEMDAIKKACVSIEEVYRPLVTFIVVQKRHHTRLFPDNENMADRSGNILPGTVVDRNICHPTEFDFYLCSHAGIQGTSRPAHYRVLYDENNFSADQLQTLTNNLCYTYARCTRSISVVAPVYYAHLAAFRARYYLETGSEYGSSQISGRTRERAAAITALPAVKKNVRNVMFYC